MGFYRQYLHSPVLDAGCGAGRLLAPLREAGFDVDGCDASADMIERSRRRAPDATVWVWGLHELDHQGVSLDRPRRRLRLGSTREQDAQAIARLHDALLPRGTLVLAHRDDALLVPRRTLCRCCESGFATVDVLAGTDEHTRVYIASR